MTALVGIDYGGASASAIHQNRLVLVGSAPVPDLLLASKVGQWEDFGLTRENSEGAQVATEDDGFFVEQSSSRANGFQAVAQQEGLFLFGDIGEATVPAGQFTAGTTQLRENSWYGTELGSIPIIVGGLVCFLQSGGGDVRAIRWTEQERKYEAPSLRAMAGPVFDQAIDLAWGRSRASEADTVYVVDETGGVGLCAVRQTPPETAWSVWDVPSGRVRGCVNAGGREVFLVERSGQIRVEIPERRASQGAALMDGEATFDFEEAKAVPQWLRGQVTIAWEVCDATGEVRASDQIGEAFLDGRVDWRVVWEDQQPVFVTDDPEEELAEEDRRTRILPTGTLIREELFVREGREDDLPEVPPMLVPANVPIRVGLGYQAEIETLPFVARTRTGTRRGVTRSRIFSVSLDFVGNAPHAVLVNDRWIPARPRRDNVTDVVQSVQIGGISGWRRRQRLKVGLYHQAELAGLFYRAAG